MGSADPHQHQLGRAKHEEGDDEQKESERDQ
jgi:hypothetical protein